MENRDAGQPETAGKVKPGKRVRSGKDAAQSAAKRTRVGRVRKPSQTILENQEAEEELRLIKTRKSIKNTVKKAQKAAQSQMRCQLNKILLE